MKSIILTTALLLCGITSGYAQMTDEEFKAEKAKLQVLLKEKGDQISLWNKEYRKITDQMSEESRGANRPEEMNKLRARRSVVDDSIRQIEQQEKPLMEKMKDLKIKWAQGVLSSEESSRFLKGLLELEYTVDRNTYFKEYCDSIAKSERESLNESNEESSKEFERRLIALLYLFDGYYFENIKRQ